MPSVAKKVTVANKVEVLVFILIPSNIAANSGGAQVGKFCRK
jgi:hypothetical protein